MNGNMSELDSILAAFGNMRVNNTEIMKQAEAAILEYMHNPSCVNSFFAILLHCDTPVYRQMAALFLRRVIGIYWSGMSSQDKEEIKSQVLKALRKEPFHLARRAICGVVSKIGSIELEAQQWPEVLNAINSFISSAEASERETGMLLLYSLHEVISKYITNENLVSVLQMGIRDSDASVRSMAVKAAADVITSLIGDATISQLSSLIPDLLQVLSFAISSYDAELAVRIFGLFDDTTTSSEPFLQPCLREVLDACCATVNNAETLMTIRCAACSCLSSLVGSFYMAIHEMNLTHDIICVILAHISDDASPVGETRSLDRRAATTSRALSASCARLRSTRFPRTSLPKTLCRRSWASWDRCAPRRTGWSAAPPPCRCSSWWSRAWTRSRRWRASWASRCGRCSTTPAWR